MAIVRKLAYRDRYVWYLTQTMAGAGGLLPPLTFADNTELPFVVKLTGNQFNRTLGCLMTGADLLYPDESHQVVWDFLKWVEQPVDFEIPPTMINIDLWTANADVIGSTITYFNAAFMPFNYVMFSDNLTGRMMRNAGVWLRAGTYQYYGWHSKSNSSGITNIVLHTAAAGIVVTILSNIDEYNAAFTARFQVSATFTCPADGFYNVIAMNNGTKNAASGGFAVNWTSHHIRQLT